MTSAQDHVNQAREDTVRGSVAFYAVVHNRWIPDHVIPWLKAFHEVADSREGLLVKAFRGGSKTTTFATEIAHQIGIHPDKTALMVRASDPAAAETAELVANMIEFNQAWAAVFPNVAADKERGWSQAGYYVVDKSKDYGEWSRMVSVRKDPTLAAMGYGSKGLHGYHPSIAIWLDDLMDDDNAYSAREMQRLKRIISGTILPMALVNQPRIVISGLPWTKEDAIAAAEATGTYRIVSTWATKDGKRDGEPTWEEMFDRKALEAAEKADITGGIEFRRNFFGDMDAAKNRVFVYHGYPYDKISTSWAAVGGADPAGVMDPTKRTMDHSHFALAYLLKRPEGGVVVYDGVLEQFSYAEGEESIMTAQRTFPAWETTVLEGDGVGEAFLAMLSRHPSIHVFPKKTGGKNKAVKLVEGLGPWLRNGRVMISNEETKFLNALRSFLDRYPAVSQHDPGWDAADAVYLALYAMPDVLQMPNADQASPNELSAPRKKKVQPWIGLRSSHA